MALPSDISVGLCHEMAITGCKAGWEPEDFTVLAQSEEKMKQMLAYVRGDAEITPLAAIDCDADPFVPDGQSVKEHKQGGKLVWDATKVMLCLADGQRNGGRITGHELRKKFQDQPVLNANILDYLRAHPHLIPEEWKGNRAVFFWGTIYCDCDGELYVRSLYWDGDWWRCYCHWLGSDWGGSYPAALYVK